MVMLDPAAHGSLVIVAVVDLHIGKPNVARCHVHRVAARVNYVAEVELKLYVIGIDVTIQVYCVEIAQQHCMAGDLPTHVACEGRHERLHKLDIGLVGIEIEVKRVLLREDGAVDERVQAVVLRDVGIDGHRLVLVVPVALDIGIAHERSIVLDIFHLEVGCFQARSSRKQVTGKESASCPPAKLHIAYVERFKDVVKVDILDRECQLIGRIFRHLAFDIDKLLTTAGVNAVDNHCTMGYIE